MQFRLEAYDQTTADLFKEAEEFLQRFGKTQIIEHIRPPSGQSEPDGFLTIIAPNGGTSRYVCESKRRIDRAASLQIIYGLKIQAASMGVKPLLVVPHVNDSLAETLREHGIAYFDTAGNACFINDPLVYIWLQGFKPPKQPERVTRAFQATGLQLIALLLARPEAINRPYRQLAEEAGLSLASVSRIVSELRSLGFVSLISSNQSAVVNRRTLLEHWEFGYSTRLRPQLKPTTYRQAENVPVEALAQRMPAAMKDDILIGGELAAAIATRHLRPQTVSFHVRPHRSLPPIIKELKLIPDRNGNITFIEQFGQTSTWKWQAHVNERLIHPLLIYAELINEKPDSRLLETAKLIYDAHIAPILENEKTSNPTRTELPAEPKTGR